MTTPLSDEQADKVMRKMCSFIEQEALEKAKEIKVKADEDYNVEKAKIVRRDTLAIDEQNKKKQHKEEIKKKIFASHYSNEAKLKVLSKQDEMLCGLFEETKQKLISLVKDQKYKAVLEDLIVQGLYGLLEQDVSLSCRQEDEDLVKRVLPSALSRASNSRVDFKVQIDKVYLKESDIGGVIMSSNNGKIRILNSFAARLEVARESLLPAIKVKLYGTPANRRFFD